MTTERQTFPVVSWRWDRNRQLRAEAAVRVHRSTEARRKELTWWAVATIVVLAVAVATGSGSISQMAIMFVFIMGLSVFGSVVGRWVEIRLRVLRYAKRCMPAYELTRVVVRPDGIRYEWSEAALELKWRSIKRLVDTPEFVLLYTGPAAASYVPKDGFADSETARRFVTFVQAHLPETS